MAEQQLVTDLRREARRGLRKALLDGGLPLGRQLRKYSAPLPVNTSGCDPWRARSAACSSSRRRCSSRSAATSCADSSSRKVPGSRSSKGDRRDRMG
jgi:hypothetical protein